MSKKRIIYIALLGLTIALGLVSRSSLFDTESPLQLYAGDTLWAMAVFWGLAIIFPKAPTLHYALGALLIAFAIETSQLYQSDWINQLRSYRLGALTLGHTFIWSDLACYTAGAWFAANIDHFLVKKEWESPWNWWLNSTIKDKLIVLGCLGLALSAMLFVVGLIEYKILGASIGALFIGFMMRSEDSTDI